MRQQLDRAVRVLLDDVFGDRRIHDDGVDFAVDQFVENLVHVLGADNIHADIRLYQRLDQLFAGGARLDADLSVQEILRRVEVGAGPVEHRQCRAIIVLGENDFMLGLAAAAHAGH